MQKGNIGITRCLIHQKPTHILQYFAMIIKYSSKNAYFFKKILFPFTKSSVFLFHFKNKTSYAFKCYFKHVDANFKILEIFIRALTKKFKAFLIKWIGQIRI